MEPVRKMLWTQAYSVGVPELDQQHKVLFDIINRVAVLDGSADSSERLHEILIALFDYFESHCKSEESYMQMISYPGFDGQKAQHEEFLNKLDAISTKALDHKLDSVELYYFLRGWLIEHVMESDQQYRRYFEESHSRT